MVERSKYKEQNETLSGQEDFFQPDDGTGESFFVCLFVCCFLFLFFFFLGGGGGGEMARITEQVLRRKKSKKNEEKMKGLRKKYKRSKTLKTSKLPVSRILLKDK